MSHDEEHEKPDLRGKHVRMANQIGTFFLSKPHDLGVAGVAEHINKFWDPRMRKLFFEVVDEGGDGLLPIVIDAAATIRRPNQHVTPAQAAEIEHGPAGGKGTAAGETISRIAASQG